MDWITWCAGALAVLGLGFYAGIVMAHRKVRARLAAEPLELPWGDQADLDEARAALCQPLQEGELGYGTLQGDSLDAVSTSAFCARSLDSEELARRRAVGIARDRLQWRLWAWLPWRRIAAWRASRRLSKDDDFMTLSEYLEQEPSE